MTKIRVRVEFTVEVDADDWELNYGTPKSEMRDDVREWLRNAAATAPVPMIPVR